jgi:hypothetical protein
MIGGRLGDACLAAIELLPETAALILSTAGVGGIVLWGRRTIRRKARAASAKTNIA